MKIVVVGGGTAGWLTALTARMTFPDHDITVLESEEIGIIGAGEGTTPQIVPLLDSLGIPFSDLVRFCDATIKQSIKFTNWQGSGDSYHHAFITNKDLQFVKEPNELLTMRQTPSVDAHIYASMLGDPQDAYNLAASLSLQNKIPFVEGRRNLSECTNPIHLYDGLAAFAIHFNATKLAGYLRQVAAARDIKQTDGIVGRIITDDYGSITTIVSDKGETIEGDFFFDCTGFHRVLIGKFYGSKWISYKDILPADKAIGYFKPMDHDIPSYTEAIAMNNGWSWQIPLTARYGAGYVYSSAFTNLNDVEKEIVEMEGENIEWGREFSFEAGCYEKIWVKNCVAVGLAAGFLEPLEATSIMQTILTLETILSHGVSLIEGNSKHRAFVNEFNVTMTKEIVDFLYLHYFTTRSDTDFWRSFDYGAKEMPERVLNTVELAKERALSEADYSGNRLIFTSTNYQAVIVGNGLLSIEDMRRHYTNQRVDRMEEYLSLRRNVGLTTLQATNHNLFLNRMLIKT